MIQSYMILSLSISYHWSLDVGHLNAWNLCDSPSCQYLIC